MADSFHSARLTRLRLALQMTQMTEIHRSIAGLNREDAKDAKASQLRVGWAWIEGPLTGVVAFSRPEGV